MIYMLGKTPNIYWKATWIVIAPFLLGCILIGSVYSLVAEVIGYDPWSSTKVCNPINCFFYYICLSNF